MFEEPVSRRWCMLVKLNDSADAVRIREVGLAYAALVQRWAGNEWEMIPLDKFKFAFGTLLRTTVPAEMMRAEFVGSNATRDGDAILILEMGESFSGSGFSRAWTWLQRH